MIQMLTVEQAARRLQVSEVTMRNWLRQGRIPGAVKISGYFWRIPEHDLEAWIRRLADPGDDAGKA